MPFGGKNMLTPTQAMAAKLPVRGSETDTCSVMAYATPDKRRIRVRHTAYAGHPRSAIEHPPYVGVRFYTSAEIDLKRSPGA